MRINSLAELSPSEASGVKHWGCFFTRRCNVDEGMNQILNKIKKFRDDRDWMQFHDPKNMAVSIILEASELLEHFQWKTVEEVEEYAKQNHDEIKDEIADIALYLFELADNLSVDLINAMEQKLAKNEKKYPAEKARGKHTKYNQF